MQVVLSEEDDDDDDDDDGYVVLCPLLDRRLSSGFSSWPTTSSAIPSCRANVHVQSNLLCQPSSASRSLLVDFNGSNVIRDMDFECSFSNNATGGIVRLQLNI